MLARILLGAAAAAAAVVAIVGLAGEEPRFKALAFSSTEGFRHDSIEAGHDALDQLAADNDFEVDRTEDSGMFTEETLSEYDTVVFLSTTGNVLDEEQQAAFEGHIQGGGGYVGIHSASDTEYDWNWYGHLVGAYFLDHPPGTAEAAINVEDHDHPATADLPDRYERVDEWYSFKSPDFADVGEDPYSPRDAVRVLATVDESTYDAGENGLGDDHPVTWCQAYEGGSSWYTAMGHTEESFAEEEFLTQVLGGLETTAGVEPAGACAAGDGEDTTPPVTTIQLNGSDPVDSYDGPVEVSLSAEDPDGGSGVDVTEIRVDGGDWQRYVAEEVIFDGTQETFDDWTMAPGGEFDLNEEEGYMRTIGGLGMLWYAAKEYGDMRLRLQFRDSRGGTDADRSNAGVFIRFPNPYEAVALPPEERYDCQVNADGLPDGGEDPAWSAVYCGQEIQIYDGETGDPQKTGSVYNFAPLGLEDANPVAKGEWSDYEITVEGDGDYSVTVTRDGEVINEFENTPGQDPAREGDPPTNDRQFATGYVGLQNHGGDDVIDFRDVRVLPLDDGAVEGPLTIDGEGEHTVEFRSVDNAGNEEEPQATVRLRVKG